MSSSLLLSGCEMISAQEYYPAESSVNSQANVTKNIEIEKTKNEVTEYPNFEEINNVTIGDVTVSLPFKAEELGDEFYVDNYVDEKGTVYKKIYCLFYNQIPISFVDVDDNNSITHIECDFSENETELPIFWSIYLFDGDSESEDVLKNLGKPTKSFIADDNLNRMNEIYTYVYESGVFSIHFRNHKLERILLEIREEE